MDSVTRQPNLYVTWTPSAIARFTEHAARYRRSLPELARLVLEDWMAAEEEAGVSNEPVRELT